MHTTGILALLAELFFYNVGPSGPMNDPALLQVESYLEKKLKSGMNKVSGGLVILDQDDENSAVITTDGSTLELYCHMVKDDMDQNQRPYRASWTSGGG